VPSRNENMQEANEKDSLALVGSVSIRGRDKKTRIGPEVSWRDAE
jgi:hypothetical protein